jgi:multidrug efflux pump subunit AcrB
MKINSIFDVRLAAKIRPKEVTFQMPNLSEEANVAWETRFNDLLSECGCASGQQFIMYASPVFIISLILLINYTDLSRQLILVLFFLAVIVAGAAGKITGLIQRNYKLKKLVDDFKHSNSLAD